MTPSAVIEDFLLATFSEGDLIRVNFADGSVFESTSTAELVEEIIAGLADEPWIDLVDGAGNAHGLFLPGDAKVVDPLPSFIVDGGMVYTLADGAVIPDEPSDKHLLPVSTILETIDWQSFALSDLSISTPGSEMEIILSQGRNRMEKQGAWKPLRSVFGQFSDALQQHSEGKKDGPCFLQGECAGGTRKAAAMIANYIIGVDLDSGAPLDDVMESIIGAGLEAVIYTTHSHLKDTSQIKRDHFLKWADTDEVTPELCADYLMQVKGVIPAIAKGVEILDEALHTEEGIVVLVRHQPMPKFRAVFPLHEPFIFGRRGGTQQDAIAEWKERYAGFASAMNFFFDETCVDPARLFYLPRHKRGDVFGSWWVAGRPVNLDDYDRVKMKRGKKGKRAVPQNAFSNFGDGADEENDRNRYVFNGESLVPWAKKIGKVFEIEEFLSEHCPDSIREARSGKAGVHVECPFEAEHSNFGGGGTYVVNASDNMNEGFDGGFTFHCVHNACSGRDRLDFLKGCLEEEWFTLDDLQDKRFRVELEEEEDEEEEEPPVRKTSTTKAEPAKKEPVYEQAVDDDDDEARMLSDFNRRYAVVVNGGAVKILREPVLEDDDYQFLTQSDVSLLEKNKIIYLHDAKRNKTERIEAFKQWLEWEKRRTYQGVVFAPGRTGGDQAFNLFGGFPIEPLKGDWSLLREHIYENICESDDDLFDWFMTWMAQLVQQPDRKPGSTLVVTGEKGTGKSTTFDYLGMLLGRHSITVSQRKQIVGNFNAHIATALLMVCEEAFWAADPQAEGVLKDMITNKHTLIEKKGYDPIKSQNYTRLVLISNSDWVVPASLKDERRFGVYRCSDRRRGDIAFFEALRNQMENEGGLQAMMYELLHYKPLSGSFGILFTPPKTRYLQRQQVETLTGVDRFMLELMRTGVYEPTNENIDAVELEMDKETLVYAVNLRSCVEDYVRMRFASEKAKTSYDDISTVAEQWFGATESMLLVEGAMNKKRALRFPPLNEARSALKERTGLEIDFMEVEVASMVRRS